MSETEKDELAMLVSRIKSTTDAIGAHPVGDVEMDLLEVAAHLLTNVLFQVSKGCAKTAVEPVKEEKPIFEPGHKCEVNFSRPDGPYSDYWQIATVTDVRIREGVEYRTTATTDWISANQVRVPVVREA